MSVAFLNPDEIAEMKKIAALYNVSVADFVRNAIRGYIEEKQDSLFYKLNDVEEASPEESAEILALLDSMTEEDHEVVRVDRFIPI